MHAQRLMELGNELGAYMHRFDVRFGRCETRRHMMADLSGQMYDLAAKSVEPIVLQAGTPAQTLQKLLAQHRWNEDAVRQRLSEVDREEHTSLNSVGIFDETSDVKKGDKTPGVQRAE